MVCIQTRVIHVCIETKQKYEFDTINAAVLTINCLPKTLAFQSGYH